MPSPFTVRFSELETPSRPTTNCFRLFRGLPVSVLPHYQDEIEQAGPENAVVTLWETEVQPIGNVQPVQTGYKVTEVEAGEDL